MKNLKCNLMMRRIRTNGGFTLIEILLVLALLGLVVSIAAPRIFGGMGRGKIQATKIKIKQLEGDLDRYRLECNFYPTTEQGLQALLKAPTNGRTCKNYNPEGYTRKEALKDAWDTQFNYTCDDGVNYKISSYGADGTEGGEGESKDLSSVDE